MAKLPKVTRKFDLHYDLGMNEIYKGHYIIGWADPHQSLISDIVVVAFTPVEELQEKAKTNERELEEYYAAFATAAGKLILDSNIEGFDISTREKFDDSMQNTDFPISFIYNVIIAYIGRIISSSTELKKKLMKPNKISSSGNDNSETEAKDQEQT